MADLRDDNGPLVWYQVRRIGYILPDVVVEEGESDTLTVTQHPVEKGSPISDHAFKNASKIQMTCGWSDAVGGTGYSREVYDAVLALQKSREPFTVSTGKRNYTNMLVTGISSTTDRRTEKSLMLSLSLEEVRITSTGGASQESQALPQKTASAVNVGRVQGVPVP